MYFLEMYKHIFGFDCYESDDEAVTEKSKIGVEESSAMETFPGEVRDEIHV